MLCQFTFKNFKSYKSETVFDLQATNIPEFADALIKTEKCNDILPVSVVYGPNGGGKTNLLQALACLISVVTEPIIQLEHTRIPTVMQHRVPVSPFLFDDVSADDPTEFQIYFRTEHNEFRYYLTLTGNEVIEETLMRRSFGAKKSAHIFERTRSKIELGPVLRGLGVATNVNAKMPYLSFLAITYDIPIIAEVQEWFESCIILNYGNPGVERIIMSSDDSAFNELVVNLLNDAGVSIEGYRFDDDSDDVFVMRTVRGKTYELLMDDESEGTKKLVAIMPVLLLALTDGRLAVIDELDAKLHPKLLRYIISLFKNPDINRYGAQLLFSSHDMTTMNKQVFRRDEIWFAAINDDRESEIYSLYDIRLENNERVHNTASYSKQYLEGRYGADPYLQNMLGGDWS